MYINMSMRSVFYCFLVTILATFASSTVQASTPIPPFQMAVGVSTPEVNYGKVRISNPGPPVLFETRVLPNLEPSSLKFDIYFGGVSPARRVFSWVPSTGQVVQGFSLVEGLVPLEKSVVIDGPKTPFDLLGGVNISHQFSSADQVGMYLLFSFVVPEGADPSDTDNWLVQDSMYLAILP